MKKILIAYDGSRGAEIAIRDLLRGGFGNTAEVKVLTIADVWLPPAMASGEDLLPEQQSVAQAHKKATELVRMAKKTAVQGAQLVHQLFPEWKVFNSAEAESPAWGILAEATRWRPDLIVVGSHGRTPLGKFFLGSVSAKVAAEACCSVRVVRSQTFSSNQPLRLMIGLDGSPDSQRAVEEVLQRRWSAGTQVDLVTVVDEKLTSVVLARPGLLGNPCAIERVEDGVQALLDRAYDALAQRELKVSCHIFDGDPKSTLLRQAKEWKVDCIFLGARGIERSDPLHFGTLASAICTRAHCTVEIVRAPHL